MAAFAGVLALLAVAEMLAPRRRQAIGRRKRWPANLGLVAIDTLLVRLLFPVAAVGAAIFAGSVDGGCSTSSTGRAGSRVGAAVILLDLLIYAQHVLFHAVPALWRMHRVHHADLEFDVTTGLRFHPVEIVLSMLIKIAAVVLLGARRAGGADFRSAAQRDCDVEPFEHPPAARASTAWCAG